MEKKYSITDETMTLEDGTVLHRIRAEKKLFIYNSALVLAEKGTLGGWIESEDNLSQEGNCWVCETAKVYGNAKICDNALIRMDAQVFDNAIIGGESFIADTAKVYGNAKIGCIKTSGWNSPSIRGKANVFGNARVDELGVQVVEIYERAKIYGNAQIVGKSCTCISGNVEIYDNAKINGGVGIGGKTEIYGDAVVDSKVFIFLNRDQKINHGTVGLDSIDDELAF